MSSPANLHDIAERLRSIEEDLRDLAYESLRDATRGDEVAAKQERVLQSARRAVSKAAHLLDPPVLEG